MVLQLYFTTDLYELLFLFTSVALNSIIHQKDKSGESVTLSPLVHVLSPFTANARAAFVACDRFAVAKAFYVSVRVPFAVYTS